MTACQIRREGRRSFVCESAGRANEIRDAGAEVSPSVARNSNRESASPCAQRAASPQLLRSETRAGPPPQPPSNKHARNTLNPGLLYYHGDSRPGVIKQG